MKKKLILAIISLAFILTSCMPGDFTEDVYFGNVYSNGTLLTSGNGTSDHSVLTNLDYASSEHTGFEPTLTSGNTSQFWRGDKTWQTIAGGGDMLKAIYDSNDDGIIALAQLDVATENQTGSQAKVNTHNGTYVHTDIALNTADRHTHTNKAVLDATQESFTTALKTSYDWLVTNITSAWKTLVDNHLAATNNPHTVTKTQVGLTNVTDEAQIAKSIGTAKGDIIGFSASGTPIRIGYTAVNGDVLVVDTTQSTGLKFATPTGAPDGRLIVDAVTTGEQHDVTASTDLTKVTAIDVPLAAGTYVFRYDVIYRSNQATNGIRLAVNYSGTNGAFVWNWRTVSTVATASNAAADQDAILATASVENVFASRAKSSTTRGTTLSVDTIDADMYAIIEGVFVATGAGNLELWHGSEVNTAGYTTSVMIGTSIVVTKTK